jgi:hypothetical protein
MYMHLSPQRMSVPPPAREQSALHRSDVTERAGWREATGIASLVMLLFALVSPADLRVVLSSVGLAGLLGVRLAAADSGWARRGAAWSRGAQQQVA